MPDVSITGLRLKSVLQGPVFWWHAIWSMGQARAAPGNISARARTINGTHHTLTVWDSEAAMRALHGTSTGKTLGYHTATPPGCEDVHQIWPDRGRTV